MQLTSYWYTPIAVCLIALSYMQVKFLNYQTQDIHLDFRLGASVYARSYICRLVPKLKQPSNDSSKNRGGQAIIDVIVTTIYSLETSNK